MYDGITRLGKVYTKLIASGCVLFENCQAKFLCDPARSVCVFIDFGQGDQRQTLKGHHEEEDLSLIIPKLAKFMEECLQAWMEYIERKRNEYFHLNYFSIDQLVILQRELVKIGTDKEPTDLIYSLLSFVKSNCSRDDIITAMMAAKEDVNSKLEADTNNMNDEIMVDIEGNPEEDKIKTFIKEVTGFGFSEELVRRALQFIEPDKIDDGNNSFNKFINCIF